MNMTSRNFECVFFRKRLGLSFRLSDGKIVVLQIDHTLEDFEKCQQEIWNYLPCLSSLSNETSSVSSYSVMEAVEMKEIETSFHAHVADGSASMLTLQVYLFISLSLKEQ